MKQRIVIRTSIHNDKCRSKALKIVVSIPGVESLAVIGEEKDLVEVVGDRIDSVELTRRLRKKMGHAELLSVGDANYYEYPSSPSSPAPVVAAVALPYCGCPPYYYYEVTEPTCTIL